MKTPKYLLFHQVLEWCNKIRTDRGKPVLDALPQGYPNNGYSCPCGEATGVFVGCQGWANTQIEYDNLDILTFPLAVGEFVERFDGGEFPELER